MKLLSPSHVKPLADALVEAFPSVAQLDALLHADTLGKQFDDLSSKYVPLRESAQTIAGKALSQGWASELLAAAMEANKDNPRLRALWASLPEGDDQVPVDEVLDGRPSLKCGRADQWNEIETCYPAASHHVIVVAGAEGQDPVHFRERIHTWLDTRPPREMFLVDWPTRPTRREAFFEAIEHALDVSRFSLPQVLADRLSVKNLVLLHPCVPLRFKDDALVDYYTVWLPEVLKDIPNACKLKCVQPIQWPLPQRSLLARLFSGGDDDPNGESGARGLMAQLEAKASDMMPVMTLTELVNLDDKEIASFVKVSGLTARQQALMLEQVSAVPPLPTRIFETIDAYWSHVEAAR